MLEIAFSSLENVEDEGKNDIELFKRIKRVALGVADSFLL